MTALQASSAISSQPYNKHNLSIETSYTCYSTIPDRHTYLSGPKAYIKKPMDSILDTRVPKGGGGFKYKGGSGSGGGGGGSLAWWAWLIIIFSVVWLFAYITLLVHFFRTDYIGTHSSERPRFGLRLFGRLAWKAFRYATGIQVFIWAFRKIRSKTDRDTKKVGGSFYRKIDEEEQGMKSGNEQLVMPPAQLRHEPAPPPAYSNAAVR